MSKCKGSFTVEASYIMPIILVCILIVIELGISLHGEVFLRIKNQEKKEPLDMINTMYQREYVKELLGEFYED